MQPRNPAILMSLAAVIAFAQMSDYKGYKDPALLTPMPHYFMADES